MEKPLTRMQLDILELERTTMTDADKVFDFRRRHPSVTAIGYTVALMRLLDNPAAWEYADRRYASTLGRIQRLHRGREAHRAATRSVTLE